MASPALVQLTGVDPSHPLDLDGLLARLFFNSRVDVLNPLRRQRRGEAPLAPVRASSSTHTLELTAGSGETWLLTLHDCTLQERERERLLATLDEAQRYADLSALLPAVAHDLNNILTMLGHTIDLAEDMSPPQLERLLARRDRQMEHGRALTQAISSLGLADAPPGPGNPRALIQRFQSTFSSPHGGLRLRFTPPEEPTSQILVDRVRFERVLLNLMVNARHAAGNDGSLDISLKRWDAARVAEETRGRLHTACVCISVSDDGPGIPLDVLPRVFEAGYTTRRERGGTGLGLSTARRLMLSLGGEILAESPPGEGATFRLLFPESPQNRPRQRGEI